MCFESSNVFDGSDYDGVELGRMTGYGHTGLGSYWTNDFAPQRTLDVIKQTNDPQFRITRQRNKSINSGTNADFQVSEHGNLHIVPKDIRTGYNPEEVCYRGKVAIGEEVVKDSKLMVVNLSPRDNVNTGIAAYSFVSDFTEEVGIGINANSWRYPQDKLYYKKL